VPGTGTGTPESKSKRRATAEPGEVIEINSINNYKFKNIGN
jgi:hypothetical protein